MQGVPLAPAPSAFTPLTGIQTLDAALIDLAAVLNGVQGLQWGVHGSCAARVRGASVVPGDIDAVVNSFFPAVGAMEHSPQFQIRSHHRFLAKFTHKATNTEIDLADASTFMPHFKAEDIHGVKVFTLPEVIISLITRDQKEAREKDQKAFSYLIRKKGELLNAEDKERIVGILRQKFNMPSLVWDDVVKQAQDIKAQFKAEKKQTTPTQPTQNRLQIPTAEELFKQRRQQKLASLPRRPGKGV